MSQSNALDAWGIWKGPNAAAASGAIVGTPQYITKQAWDATNGQGAVLTLNTVKLTAGYMIFWNSQYNYKTSASAGTVIQTWFSPRWYNGDTNQFVNYLCQDTIGGNIGALTHTWVNTITAGVKDINTALPSTGAPTATTTGVSVQGSSSSVVFSGQQQGNAADSFGQFNTGCFGGRSIYLTEAPYLAVLKVGSSFQYTSGYKRFNNNVVAAQSAVTSLTTYTVVDVASSSGSKSSSTSSSIPQMTWDQIWTSKPQFSSDLVYSGPSMLTKTTATQSFTVSSARQTTSNYTMVGSMSSKKVVYQGKTTYWWGYSTQINYKNALASGDTLSQNMTLYNQIPTNPTNTLNFYCNYTLYNSVATIQTNISCGNTNLIINEALTSSCPNVKPQSNFNMFSSRVGLNGESTQFYCVNFRSSNDIAFNVAAYKPGKTISFRSGWYYAPSSKSVAPDSGLSNILTFVLLDSANMLAASLTGTLASLTMLI